MRPDDGFAAVRETILELFPRARGLLRGEVSRGELAGELPLRAELFSAERMERHGRALAGQHQIGPAGARDALLARLSANRRVLGNAVRLLTEAVAANRRITPAGEWLLDNYYLIEDQIRTARRDLPRNYSRELPRLANGPSTGLPRVYDIALEAISHGDGRVDAESLSRFIAAYQSESPLRLGELWAIPIMLRLALIENLRRVAAWVVVDRIDRNLADAWADRMTGVAESDPKSLILVIADMARSEPPMASSFVAELARRLQGQGSALALPLTWVEQWLSESGLTIEGQVQVENQQQAADQVSISNSIGSLRFLSAMDWREFVETMSAVEMILRTDPAGVHDRMNFTTRDRYRHVIEELAKRSALSEPGVAQKAVELAHPGAAHVGYFLVGEGKPLLERAIEARTPAVIALARAIRGAALTAYLGPIALIALLGVGVLLDAVLRDALPAWVPWLVGVLALFVASELGVALVNSAAPLLSRPEPLPRMDFSHGIPSDARTLAVVPTMLGDAAGIDRLVEALEVRFLANRDEHLHFGLLTDFLDAPQESLAGDEALLDLARERIEGLNRRYAPVAANRFFLFHRPRLWNPKEGAWIGYERKRGKLASLNALLRGGARDGFSLIVGDTTVLSNVRYVITLDTDTQLPRDSAREFVAALAHPLNRPQFDPQLGPRARRVRAGYAILQPRVGVSLPGARGSRYARLFGSEPGIDPYTRAVSDVYQDLFGEGSFIGKGIYDVDAFQRALEGRFPADCVLSHDLLEGCHARAGLLSDVSLFEEYPARYGADVKRRVRWLRGDWQLLPWLLPRVRLEDGRREANPLSALSRWKIIDNLRRSLVPAALLALLLTGWALLSQPGAWTLLVLSIVLAPAALVSLRELFGKPSEMPLRSHLRMVLDAAGRSFGRAAFTFACLPYEAWFSIDAIARTLWRLLVTRRHLLEWQPSSEVERADSDLLGPAFRAMWPAIVLAAGTTIALLYARPAALAAAAPVLLLWFASPALAWWLSRPRGRSRVRLSAAQRAFLGRLARKTWSFFDTCVGEEDHWLPPDNLQEHPAEVIAHRTSPTNIGLCLLANLAARDFGYIGAGEFAQRTADTLRTLQSMERHHGHFYNWYDTVSLAPLRPRYVSAVDSGNLAGHLLTLRQGLIAEADAPLLSPRVFEGLARTLEIVAEAASGEPREPIALFRRELASAQRQPPATLAAARLHLVRLAESAESIDAGLRDAAAEAKAWGGALVRQCRDLLADLAPFADAPDAPADVLASLRQLGARERIDELERLAQLAGELTAMDWGLLYDRSRHLLAIGYNADERRLDAGYYDLLASEARLASFVAIAQGELPQENWFSLGRLLTSIRGDLVLLSWGGSMFEYLMPMLVMPSYEDTLLEQTARAAVARQIDYGGEHGVPWGISESGYNTVDARLNYQYRSFGVPGLGLKRGLSQDLVVAPYASMMALMVSPEAACLNLERLAEEGCAGRFGLYEAIDYTPARLPPGQDKVLIRSFMAHHQAMGFLSLACLLLERPMQKRFAADPQFQATMLLLQERIPRAGAYQPNARELAGAGPSAAASEARLQVFSAVARAVPAVQMLSNGHYHVMVTNAGGGYSRLNDMAVTRWREDGTRDHWGSFCYLRDAESGEFWSTSLQPTCVPVEDYEAIFSDMKAEFRGRKAGIDMHTEIAVSPEDDIELRRLRVTNRSRSRRIIDITTYAEVVLGLPVADELHPAFGNLFVQTELVAPKQAILCTRRPRSAEEPVPWMFHLVAVHDADVDEISYETDRARFIGRGQSLARPHALTDARNLSNSAGSVLDPVVAIRCRIALDPEQSASVDMVSGIGADRGGCLALIDKYRDRRLADRLFDLAWTHSQVVRRQINASQADAQLYERLAAMVIHVSPVLRADAGVLLQNLRGQSGLWGHAISGDLPVVLVQIADPANIDLVRRMVQAHAYWRLKGLAVDLVIWNEDQAGYRQQLQEQIMGLISAGIGATVIDRPGGIYVRPAQQISSEDRILLQSVARVIISDRKGSLADQVGRRRARESLPPAFAPAAPAEHPPVVAELPAIETVLGNGLGGFSTDGREYVIELAPGRPTPAPWSNILANPQFGSFVSESGSSYTWSENAHEFRLTPWHNDPVCDPSGEAFYLRDEESGRVWSPSPLPWRGEGAYRTRHGFGYSVFEHIEDGIASELWIYVALDAPVKFCVLKLRNRSGRARRLSATGYVEWVLGDTRAKSHMHLVTEVVADGGALLARNPYNMEFAGRVGFFDSDETGRSITCDRTEFLGRNGSMQRPAALGRTRLSGKTGVALDPCAAIQVAFALDAGEERETVFRLGVGRDSLDATQLAQRTRGAAAAHDALAEVRRHWQDTLGAVQIETPDPAIDVLANGWLMYQTIACRFWGRSGYYQSGGAYGFRDQLQDAMAMLYAAPQAVRQHLLLCASHQFPEGDVQHWWHPPNDHGVRTRCSDDYLWLPAAVCRYVEATGDRSVLDEMVDFVDGRPLIPEEESYYDRPLRSGVRATLYQHCLRAVQRVAFGERGLPLIGSGDWNDGMNRVGHGGKGESVWLAFFLYDVLTRFGALARLVGDAPSVENCARTTAALRENLKRHAWDGAWYRRAWFDDGTPLGSSANAECRIDSIAQSWSVLSGAGDPARSRQAMQSLDEHLVRREAGLVQLLDPPFNSSVLDPGYIRGYVPGVRENGGQYTHAAVWAAMAFAKLGDRERAWELLDMINPVNHGNSPSAIATYKVEPYVAAADVYAVAPHIGRGGWTWYTGSAGWMYRLIIESLLGVQLRDGALHFAPCLPPAWTSYELRYRHQRTLYRIRVEQGAARSELRIDGVVQPGLSITLADDGVEHAVELMLA
ncbi:MAG: cyclic beta 1-2 glucan synthetase [Betaproteobacteria bacterium]|nr:cyclic beta 1-2 glucan synthetase [Betaproteobacteria bacterium]